MFVAVCRLTFQIPESGSLKAKRQVVRRITDRVRARFNASVAEVDDQDLWQKAVVALTLVGGEKRHVEEQMDKIIHFVEEIYVAPLVSREVEILGFGEQLFSEASPASGAQHKSFQIDMGTRSMAEAEGMGEWDERPAEPAPKPERKSRSPASIDEARERARKLRNPRDWEKKR